MSRKHLDEAALHELVRRLPREIEPGEDLWPRIASRIAAESEGMDRLAARLPKSVEPPSDLWADIAPRLGRRRRPPTWHRPLAAAASLGLVTVTTLVALFALMLQSAPDDALEALSVPALVASIGTASGLRGTPPREPLRGAAAVIADTLAEVRRERRALERALAADADNRDLLALWSYVYETELSLSSEVGRTAERHAWSTEI